MGFRGTDDVDEHLGRRLVCSAPASVGQILRAFMDMCASALFGEGSCVRVVRELPGATGGCCPRGIPCWSSRASHVRDVLWMARPRLSTQARPPTDTLSGAAGRRRAKEARAARAAFALVWTAAAGLHNRSRKNDGARFEIAKRLFDDV